MSEHPGTSNISVPSICPKSVRPPAFRSVPQGACWLQDSILVAGYPMGGDSLSITKGIVSRVVMTRYAHASNKLLGIQIDAAINPGGRLLAHAAC